MYNLEISNQQTRLTFDEARLFQAVRQVLASEQIASANISIAVVDDPAIHEINRQFLDHDEPTDVISFVLEPPPHLEGEVIVSADTAAKQAEQLGWGAEDELLLYLIHGTLHLTGYDDLNPAAASQMRERERFHLAQFGITPPWPET